MDGRSEFIYQTERRVSNDELYCRISLSPTLVREYANSDREAPKGRIVFRHFHPKVAVERPIMEALSLHQWMINRCWSRGLPNDEIIDAIYRVWVHGKALDYYRAFSNVLEGVMDDAIHNSDSKGPLIPVKYHSPSRAFNSIVHTSGGFPQAVQGGTEKEKGKHGRRNVDAYLYFAIAIGGLVGAVAGVVITANRDPDK